MAGRLSKGDCMVIGLAALICFVVLAGEYATYWDIYSYDASADDSGNFSVYDSGTHSYSAVLTDNGTYEAPTKFYLYYDESYGSVVHDVKVEVGAKALTQDYYLSQLVNNLKYYSVTDVTYVGADGLAKVLADVTKAPGTGLVVISGALPANVYSGNASDPIFSWISAGGSLYWAGEYIGKYIGKSDGTVSEVSGYDILFTGVSGSLNSDSGNGRAYSEIASNGYCSDLSLKNNNVKYAADPSKLVSDNLAVGYTENGCASICIFKLGGGQVCLLGGDYSNNQRSDLATVMAAGITYASVEVDHIAGTVTRSTVYGTFSHFPATHGKMVVFIYLGGDFSVYGKTTHLGAA